MLTFAAGALYLLELRPAMTPLVRSAPVDPIYTIGDNTYATALSEGRSVVKFGPLLFGLYPGGLAFASPDEAATYLLAQNLDPKAWRIYALSGSYGADSAEGFLTRSLLVTKAH